MVNGWYANLTEEQVTFVNDYLHKGADESITQAMLRTIFATVSDTAILCMQDLLDKGAESRMNMPNTVGGNWQWRMLEGDITEEHKAYLTHLTELYDRVNH